MAERVFILKGFRDVTRLKKIWNRRRARPQSKETVCGNLFLVVVTGHHFKQTKLPEKQPFTKQHGKNADCVEEHKI